MIIFNVSTTEFKIVSVGTHSVSPAKCWTRAAVLGEWFPGEHPQHHWGLVRNSNSLSYAMLGAEEHGNQDFNQTQGESPLTNLRLDLRPQT